MRSVASLALFSVALTSLPRKAVAGCNLVPSASQTYRGALGATNKPYAAPGDFVEIGVEPARSGAASRGFGPKHPDMFQLQVKAKRWFSAAAPTTRRPTRGSPSRSARSASRPSDEEDELGSPKADRDGRRITSGRRRDRAVRTVSSRR